MTTRLRIAAFAGTVKVELLRQGSNWIATTVSSDVRLTYLTLRNFSALLSILVIEALHWVPLVCLGQTACLWRSSTTQLWSWVPLLLNVYTVTRSLWVNVSDKITDSTVVALHVARVSVLLYWTCAVRLITLRVASCTARRSSTEAAA